MPSPTTAPCPQCRAPVTIEPRYDYASCMRCGTRSMLIRDRSTSPPLGSPVIYLGPASRPSAALIIPIAAGLVVALAGVAVFFLASVTKRAVSGLASAPGLPVNLPGASTAAGLASFQFSDRPLLADVDGDEVQDVVGLARRFVPDEAYWIAAHSGKDGHELWRIDSLTKKSLDHDSLRVLAGSRLVHIDGLGKVHAFELRNGQPAWGNSLPEKPRGACVTADTVVIETADQKQTAFSLDRGDPRPLPAKGACRPTYVSRNDDAPGYRVVSWSSFRELGLPELHSVPGMAAHRGLVPESGSLRFLLGSRSPGSSVSMVAAVDGKKILWKTDTPSVDPLSTTVNVTTQDAAWGQGKLVVPYVLGFAGQEGIRLACFEGATGQRCWDVVVPGVKTHVSHGVSISESQVFYSTWTSVHVFSLATGEPRWSLGTPM